MDEKIRLLCIAPYANMRSLMLSVAEEFSQIEITVYVGDLQAGLEIALRDFHNDYDAIISRGGTAAMLQDRIDLPVVEIPVTPIDIIRAMRLAGNISSPYAIVGHPKILEKAESIPALLQIPVHTYPICSEEDARRQLTALAEKHFTLLCDMVAYTTAQKMGMDAILIASDTQSIRAAFQEAVRICQNYRRLQEENRFLRRLVWNQIHNTVVYTPTGELFFSTIPDDNSPILEFLREQTLQRDEEQDHFLKQIHNVVYNIRKRIESFGGKEYTTFYFSESRVSSPDVRRGVRFLSRADAEENFRGSFYSTANLIRGLQPQIQQFNSSSQPLMVCGEVGTCKEQVVCYVYSTSAWKKHPMVIIDCFLLSEKSWSFLMDHHNSPLAKSDTTIFIQDVDVLSAQRRHQLMVCLLTMEVAKRNRVILSCICGANQRISEEGMEFTEKLECLNLFLPPLRQRASQMTQLVTYYLNYLNIKLDKQTLGVDDGALKILQSYDWPHNYSQFKRVMHELALASSGKCINAEDAENILAREKYMTTNSQRGDGRDMPLDLRMTLNELNKEIVRRVLEEEGGNRTASAQRLGIGRTTLWRLLNNT